MKKFNSVTELAKELNLSRGTIYRRAKAQGIDLNDVDQGLTDDQLDLLRTELPKGVKTNAGEKSKKTQESNENTKQLKEQIKTLQNTIAQKETQINELLQQNKNETERNAGREQELIQLVDQSQRLQLTAQQKLENTKAEMQEIESKDEQNGEQEQSKKGIWARIFKN